MTSGQLIAVDNLTSAHGAIESYLLLDQGIMRNGVEV